jgi:hypothetical protein
MRRVSPIKLCKAIDPSADWEAEWPSLWQETDAEKEERLAKRAATDKTYVDAGVLLPEEVAVARFGKGSELGVEVDMDIREEMLENAHEKALDPPEPVVAPPGSEGEPQPPEPGQDPSERAEGA